jgi:hypothetical protein
MADTTGTRWEQLKTAARKGTGTQGQSFGGGSTTSGDVTIYDTPGNVIDSGVLLSALATKSGVQQDSYIYAADTGSANAYAITLTPTPTIVAGSTALIKVANANTGASTLAVNGGSATAIKKESATGLVDLGSSDWRAGQIVGVVYDGTVWQWASGGSGLSGSGTRGTLVSEVPIGTLNGINNIFTLSFTPLANSLILFVNGVEQTPVDFTLSGNTITMTVAPKARDTDYFIARYEH